MSKTAEQIKQGIEDLKRELSALEAQHEGAEASENDAKMKALGAEVKAIVEKYGFKKHIFYVSNDNHHAMSSDCTGLDVRRLVHKLTKEAVQKGGAPSDLLAHLLHSGLL